ncbi:MAG: HAMP domain-containing histidine kinase [Actinomycetota bacterium]|nr:HAMP domain-containing histidine kinase [Actinomycetota bacterium]
MRRRLLGLHGRLLFALVFTSVVTLAVAAFALVRPLTERLREQSVENLRQVTLQAKPGFERALRRGGPDRFERLRDLGLDLQFRANARVAVSAERFTEFAYDTDVGAPPGPLLRAALQSRRTLGFVERVQNDRVTFAARLLPKDGRGGGVLVTQRQLTDVATAVEQVRTALLAAGLVGLIVAVALSVAISGTLLRRLDRLRAAVGRLTSEGASAPSPADEVRDEVGDLSRAFVRMQEALLREEATRRSFVATASHELRTPLTMLQGTMELLEEDLRDGRVDLEDAQHQVANARKELRRLSALAAELLDLSRLDAQVPLRSEPVELGELARAVAAEFALRAHELRVAVEVVPPAEPCWALGDPDATARVVRILLDNAVRHSPAGGVVRVTAGAGAEPAVEVADQGPGVLPQDRDRIFERFYRAADRAGTEGGFGLGLAIGRGLADRMGGSLTLSSGDGAGASFELRLHPAPARPTPEPEPGRPVAA